jgi:hypothetical protein
MSIAKVEKALIAFASEKAGKAIVLKGEWGTGKTHLWNKVVKTRNAALSRKKYSYVSMFGLNSPEDLKRSIFENVVACEKAGKPIDKASVLENIKNLDLSDSATPLRKALRWGKEVRVPFFSGIGGVIDSIQYAMISETIICLDDFERRGKGLSSRDVLGLISSLVESKGCSVILILNEGSLDKGDEFFSFNEKVFDYEIVFAPSVKESVSLVFDSVGDWSSALAENSIKLKINNIRLLKKVKFFAEIVEKKLQSTHPRVVQQAQCTLPLAVLAIYGSGKCEVDIDFILAYRGALSFHLPDDSCAIEVQERNQEKSKYLDDYGFGLCDEFDAAIIDLVKKGYADEDLLSVLTLRLEEKLKHDSEVALLRQAWDLFHASFTDNEAEVVAAFEAAISDALKHFTITDLESVASVYCELGREGQINSIIDKYFSEVFPGKGVRNKEDVFHWPRNTYISQKLNQYFDSLAIKGSLDELVCAVVEGAGLPGEDYRRAIAQKDFEEFYSYFSTLNSVDFTRHARALLKCGDVKSYDADAGEDYKNIFVKTYGALLRLSELSLLNKSRMAKFKFYDEAYRNQTRRE